MRRRPQGTGARLGFGVAWSAVAAALSQGATFLVSVLVARIIGRAEFGEYAVVQSTLLLAAQAATLATGFTATKYVAEYRSTDREKAGRILALCAVVAGTGSAVFALALLAASPWLAADFLRIPTADKGLAIGIVAIPALALNGLQVGILAGLESYRSLAIASGASAGLTVILCSALAWAFGLDGAIAGYAASAVLRCLIYGGFVRHECARQGIGLDWRRLRTESRVLLQFALPSALSGLVMMPAAWAAIALLAREPGGAAQVAVYSVAATLRIAVIFVPQSASNVGIAMLNNHKGLGDEGQYRRTYWINVALNGLVATLVGIAIVVASPLLVSLYGPDFAEASLVVQVLVVSAVVEAIASAVYQLVPSQEKMWLSLVAIVVPSYGLLVALAFYLAPAYGAMGLAIAVNGSCLANLFASSIVARHIGLRAAPAYGAALGLKEDALLNK